MTQLTEWQHGEEQRDWLKLHMYNIKTALEGECAILLVDPETLISRSQQRALCSSELRPRCAT